MTTTTPSREEHIASFMEVLGLTREEAEEQHEQMLREAADMDARFALLDEELDQELERVAAATPILDRLNALPHRAFYEGCGCDTCLLGRGCKTEYGFVESLSEDEADVYHRELLGLRKAAEEAWARSINRHVPFFQGIDEIPF